MAWKDVLSFAGPIIGAGIGAASSAYGQRQANQANIELARERMAFQERMYGSRYQMQMADMRKAGLNPILAFAGAPGAPGGAQAQVGSVTGQAGEILGKGVASAIQAYRARSEVRKREAEIGAVTAQARNLEADTALKAKQTDVAGAQERQLFSQTVLNNGLAVLRSAEVKVANARQQEILQSTAVAKITELIRLAELDVARANATSASEVQEIYESRYGQFLKWLEATIGSVTGSPIRGHFRVGD